MDRTTRLTAILQLDEMEIRLDEAKLGEDRLCAEMSSLRLERDPAHSPPSTGP